MSGLRFLNDPLVSVSGQFPLNTCDFRLPDVSEPPSSAPLRPFSLRGLVDLGVPAAPTSLRYCPDRQVSVDRGTGLPRPPLAKLDWTTREQRDGDEGPSKDYHWETVPDDDD
ncbi:MAG: hypothetical protein ACRDRH_18920 [Pseudonocardia sp.]